jgi:Domain of unknown function (DUF4405)
MRRITVNALVDIGCLLTFIPSFVSGVVLFLFLPSGGGRGGSWATYLGIARDQWLTMHNYWSLVFSALIIIHLILHWMYFWNIRKCFSPGKKEPDACDT